VASLDLSVFTKFRDSYLETQEKLLRDFARAVGVPKEIMMPESIADMSLQTPEQTDDASDALASVLDIIKNAPVVSLPKPGIRAVPNFRDLPSKAAQGSLCFVQSSGLSYVFAGDQWLRVQAATPTGFETGIGLDLQGAVSGRASVQGVSLMGSGWPTVQEQNVIPWFQFQSGPPSVQEVRPMVPPGRMVPFGFAVETPVPLPMDMPEPVRKFKL